MKSKLFLSSKRWYVVEENLRLLGYNNVHIIKCLSSLTQPVLLKSGVIDTTRSEWFFSWSPNFSYPFSDRYKGVKVTFSRYSFVYRLYVYPV